MYKIDTSTEKNRIEKTLGLFSIFFCVVLSVHCFHAKSITTKASDNDRLIEQKIKYFYKRIKNKEEIHVELSVSSEDFRVVSSFNSGLEWFSVSFFEVSTWEVFVISSLFSTFSIDVVDGGGTTGEFRCCSSSYSLIKRFLSGCALFDAAVGGGDVGIGGVLLTLVSVDTGLVDGLFSVDECSLVIGSDGASEEDEYV